MTDGAPVVSLSRGALQVAEVGDGNSTLVVLHGTPGGWDQGLWLGEDFVARGFTVLAPSRAGYLGSPAAEARGDAETAERLSELLRRRGAFPAGIVAWSGGASAAVELAHRHPDLVTGLVLLSPALEATRLAEEPPPDIALRAAMLLLELSPGLAGPRIAPDSASASLISEDPTVGSRMAALLATLVSRGARDVGRERDRRDLATLDLPLDRLSVPVLLVQGTADETVTPDATRRAAARIPDAELVTIEGAGHLLPLHPPYVDALPEIVEFLWRSRDR